FISSYKKVGGIAMAKEIKEIGDNERAEYTGDVHITGDIGKNASVIVKDGSLTVEGEVKEKAEVRLVSTVNSNYTIVNAVNCVFNTPVSTGKNLKVTGNVADQVKFATQSAAFSIAGNVGNNCSFKTHNGDIIVGGNVGVNTQLSTHNGNIETANLGVNTTLTTYNGDIRTEVVAQGAKATSYNGDVRVAQAHPSAELKSHMGNVYENGVKRKHKTTPQYANASSISYDFVSSMAIGSGSKTFVNGVDVTDQFNGMGPNARPHTEHPSFRYTKKT
ncbi:MAG TPA: DUF4097 family beta strand repeat-containing protein, partial [Flavobacteriales bacterium]|nr:DUF4097 family beta strand repeat-containing protein [Flavobacteriales bacterium]